MDALQLPADDHDLLAVGHVAGADDDLRVVNAGNVGDGRLAAGGDNHHVGRKVLDHGLGDLFAGSHRHAIFLALAHQPFGVVCDFLILPLVRYGRARQAAPGAILLIEGDLMAAFGGDVGSLQAGRAAAGDLYLLRGAGLLNFIALRHLLTARAHQSGIHAAGVVPARDTVGAGADFAQLARTDLVRVIRIGVHAPGHADEVDFTAAYVLVNYVGDQPGVHHAGGDHRDADRRADLTGRVEKSAGASIVLDELRPKFINI